MSEKHNLGEVGAEFKKAVVLLGALGLVLGLLLVTDVVGGGTSAGDITEKAGRWFGYDIGDDPCVEKAELLGQRVFVCNGRPFALEGGTLYGPDGRVIE